MNFKQNGGIAEFEYLQRSRNLQYMVTSNIAMLTIISLLN